MPSPMTILRFPITFPMPKFELKSFEVQQNLANLLYLFQIKSMFFGLVVMLNDLMAD